MSKLEGLVGFGLLGSTIITAATYGAADAHGLSAPEKEYIVPFFGASGFCFGANVGSSADKLDPKVGGVFAIAVTALLGASYGISYAVVKLT